MGEDLSCLFYFCRAGKRGETGEYTTVVCTKLVLINTGLGLAREWVRFEGFLQRSELFYEEAIFQ